MKQRFLLALAALLVSGACILSGPAAAASKMKLASATINDVQHEWQKEFVKELASRIGDQIETEIFPASQLGAIPRMTEGVLFGTIESFITPTAFLVGTDPRFQIFGAPGLFDSPEHLSAVIHDSEYRQHLEEFVLNKGLRVIGAIFNSPLILLTTKPVKTLDEIAGLKVRTFASPLQTEPMSELGASPIPLALSEVVPALQSGNIDAMVAGMPILTAFKYYDVAQYVTDLQFAYVVSVAVVNEAWFQAQPENARQAIIAAGRAAEATVFPWGVANVARTNQIWLDNKGQIFPLSDAERTRMMDVFKQVSDRILGSDEAVSAEYKRLRAVADKKR